MRGGARQRSDPEAVRRGLRAAEGRGASVRLRYSPVEEMAVNGIGMGRPTACILYNGGKA